MSGVSGQPWLPHDMRWSTACMEDNFPCITQTIIMIDERLLVLLQVIKMLVIVVTLFGLCWFPLHLFTIIADFNPQLRSEGKSQTSDVISTVYIAIHWLAMSNSFVNPIVYSFLNDSFRVRHDVTAMTSPHSVFYSIV